MRRHALEGRLERLIRADRHHGARHARGDRRVAVRRRAALREVAELAGHGRQTDIAGRRVARKERRARRNSLAAGTLRFA
jgi:hypothetical protein